MGAGKKCHPPELVVSQVKEIDDPDPALIDEFDEVFFGFQNPGGAFERKNHDPPATGERLPGLECGSREHPIRMLGDKTVGKPDLFAHGVPERKGEEGMRVKCCYDDSDSRTVQGF